MFKNNNYDVITMITYDEYCIMFVTWGAEGVRSAHAEERAASHG